MRRRLTGVSGNEAKRSKKMSDSYIAKKGEAESRKVNAVER